MMYVLFHPFIGFIRYLITRHNKWNSHDMRFYIVFTQVENDETHHLIFFFQRYVVVFKKEAIFLRIVYFTSSLITTVQILYGIFYKMVISGTTIHSTNDQDFMWKETCHKSKQSNHYSSQHSISLNKVGEKSSKQLQNGEISAQPLMVCYIYNMTPHFLYCCK